MTPEKAWDVVILEPVESIRGEILGLLPGGATFYCAADPAEAESLFEAAKVRLFFCADDLPGETGLMFLARTRNRWPEMRRILMAPGLDGMLFFHAMQEVEVFRYLEKPLKSQEVERAIHQALFLPGGQGCSEGRGMADPPLAPKHPNPWQGVLGAILIGLGLLAGFYALYWLKSAMGIDIFPDRHLWDFFDPGEGRPS